jgi:hypothetical protein
MQNMIDDDPGNVLNEPRQFYRPEDATPSDTGWIDAAIDEGLTSPPSDFSITEIMARHREALG